MTVDLTGGINPSREFVFVERPETPEMRDSVSFWVVDDRGEICLPRIGIEAVAANWDAHDIQVNVAFPDGRVYRLRTNMYSVHALKQEMPGFPALQQAGVRYKWDGEEAYGMLERSNPLDKIIRNEEGN
jgi:hypothetical protein